MLLLAPGLASKLDQMLNQFVKGAGVLPLFSMGKVTSRIFKKHSSTQKHSENRNPFSI